MGFGFSLALTIFAGIFLSADSGDNDDSARFEVVETETGYLYIDSRTGERWLECNSLLEKEELEELAEILKGMKEPLEMHKFSYLEQDSDESYIKNKGGVVHDTTKPPYNTVCQVSAWRGVTSPSSVNPPAILGSGFLLGIDVTNIVVATAGHNLKLPENVTKFVAKVEVAPGYYDYGYLEEAPFGVAESTIVCTNFRGEQIDDWGVILINPYSAPYFPPDRMLYITYDLVGDPTWYYEQSYTIIGYVEGEEMYEETGPCINADENNLSFNFDFDERITKGTSGSPIFVYYSGYPFAVGIKNYRTENAKIHHAKTMRNYMIDWIEGIARTPY